MASAKQMLMDCTVHVSW